MNGTLPPELAEAIAADAGRSAAGSDKADRVRRLGYELAGLQAQAEEAEAHLKDVKNRVNEFIHKKLPDALDEIQTDRLGLPDADADMVLEPYYKANISSEWPEERQNAAFAWLEANGFGSLVRHEVTYSFRRGEEERADWLVQVVQAAAERRAERLAAPARAEGREVRPEETWDVPPPVVRKTVPWNTLTSLVRTQSELPADDPARKILPLELLGAVVGRIVKIKPRKK